MKNLYYCLVAVFLFSACSTTELVTLSVAKPAPVTIPHDIRRIVVLNRTAAESQNRPADIADKVLSLEGAELDRKGADAATSGMVDELTRDTRFGEVIRYPEIQSRQGIAGIFPAPLPWTEVSGICKKYQADALFSIELFDTESGVSYAANAVTISTPLGKVPGLEHTATMSTKVKTGWRIYDANGKQLLDEYITESVLNFYGKGLNPVAAAAALLERGEAVKQAGAKAGIRYAQRILPYTQRVKRDYYVRGTENFRTARRKAQTGNWDGAATLWQQETGNPKSKIAGRACYNMAIINEINGNLPQAINWAQKAYEEYTNKPALRYLSVLERRLAEQEMLSQQTAKN